MGCGDSTKAFFPSVIVDTSAHLWIVYNLFSQAPKLPNSTVFCSKVTLCLVHKRKKERIEKQGGVVSGCYNYIERL